MGKRKNMLNLQTVSSVVISIGMLLVSIVGLWYSIFKPITFAINLNYFVIIELILLGVVIYGLKLYKPILS